MEGGERNAHGEVGSVSLGRVERVVIYSLRGDYSGFINGWGDDWRCYCSGLWKGGCYGSISINIALVDRVYSW